MEHEFRRVYAHAALVLASGGKNNFVATKTITPTRYESVGCDEENFSSPEESLPASGVIFFFEHKSHEFNESLRETKRKPFMEIHGQFMAIGVKHKLSEITRE